MRRAVLFLFLAVFAVAVVPVAGSAADQISEARIIAHIKALSVDIGPRPAGSAHSIRAADYIAKEFASYGYHVRFQTFSFTESYTRGAVNVTSKNVIAARPGKDPQRILVIGAHYDSVSESPGADDNASGTAVMLEVAAVLAKRVPEITIEFAAFGAEEDGLAGSYEYVKLAKGKTIVGMINIDMVGVGKSFLVANVKDTNYLVELALDLAKKMGIAVIREHWGQGDHVPFEEAGIPAVFFNRPENDDIHSPRDTIDKIVPAYVVEVARLALAAALRHYTP